MASTEPVHFDGPCPFLSCFRDGPHDHPVCPDCGAVRYGNATCPTCRAQFQVDPTRGEAEHVRWRWD